MIECWIALYEWQMIINLSKDKRESKGFKKERPNTISFGRVKLGIGQPDGLPHVIPNDR